jgi:YidC/Oxa1 family membrane protein insertase
VQPPPLANVFQPLINVFEATLKVFHDDIGMSWGLAIIALTVLIRFLLLPLTLRQARSMHRIAQLAPEIKKLRARHGSDPQRLQHETMAFYREHKINPLASFLPALAQLPVFLSLYYTLRIDLRHDICPAVNPPGAPNPHSCGETAASHFLFIPDLTSRATGAVLVVLIVLYVGSQLLSFRMSANPTTDTTQRRVLLALPFVFTPIATQLPAGLLVYWITTNIWTISQTAIVHKPLVSRQQAAAGRSGGLGGLFKRLRSRDQAEPPLAGRRPRGSSDATTNVPAGSGPRRSTVGSRAAGHERHASADPPAPPRHKKKRSGRRR